MSNETHEYNVADDYEIVISGDEVSDDESETPPVTPPKLTKKGKPYKARAPMTEEQKEKLREGQRLYYEKRRKWKEENPGEPFPKKPKNPKREKRTPARSTDISSMSPHNDNKAKLMHVKENKEGICTVKELFVNALEEYKKVGKNMYLYDARNNNCQWFVRNLLKGQGIWSPEIEKFVMQDGEKLLENMSKIGSTVKGVTNLASALDTLINGKGKRAPREPGLYRGVKSFNPPTEANAQYAPPISDHSTVGGGFLTKFILKKVVDKVVEKVGGINNAVKLTDDTLKKIADSDIAKEIFKKK